MAAPKKATAGSSTQRTRMLDGKKVRGVLYNGRASGQGKFMAAEVDGQMIMDSQGKPLPFNQVGELV